MLLINIQNDKLLSDNVSHLIGRFQSEDGMMELIKFNDFYTGLQYVTDVTVKLASFIKALLSKLDPF